MIAFETNIKTYDINKIEYLEYDILDDTYAVIQPNGHIIKMHSVTYSGEIYKTLEDAKTALMKDINKELVEFYSRIQHLEDRKKKVLLLKENEL